MLRSTTIIVKRDYVGGRESEEVMEWFKPTSGCEMGGFQGQNKNSFVIAPVHSFVSFNIRP